MGLARARVERLMRPKGRRREDESMMGELAEGPGGLLEPPREVLCRGGEAFSAGLRALDEDGGAPLCGDGLYTVLEERGDH